MRRIRRRINRISFWSIFALWACACQSPPEFDPAAMPYQGSEVFSLEDQTSFADLDHDGRDELVNFHISPDGASILQLKSSEGLIIEQANYIGIICSVRFLDLDQDGTLEIVVPYVRQDSLFIGFIDAKGKKLFSFFALSGRARTEANNVFAWDPVVVSCEAADIDHDQRPELVMIVTTNLARLPRGVFIYSLPGGHRLDQKLIGAAFTNGILDDFDHDGILELFTSTFAPNNGVTLGGFDDQHSYLIVFKLTNPLEIIWSREVGHRWTKPQIVYDDFDGDGQKEILSFVGTESSSPEKAVFEMIAPGTWRTLQKRVFDEPLANLIIGDFNHTISSQIFVQHGPNEIWAFDHQFNLIRQQTFPRTLTSFYTMNDFDGDGMYEMVLNFDKYSLLTGLDFKPKALLSDGYFTHVMRRGISSSPDIVAENAGKATILRMQKNRFYLVRQYGATVIWLLGAGLAVGFGITVFSLSRRRRLQQVLQRFVLDTDDRGLLLLNAGGKVVMTNATWRQWFAAHDRRNGRVLSWQESTAEPALAAFLKRALMFPAVRRETRLNLTRQGRECAAQVIVDPIPMPRAKQPYWLVSLIDRSAAVDLQQAKTWSRLTQHVAHEIKNPLTSILLTLQRLQTEYRQHSPETAPAYDDYTDRILERIESLRRMTRNFMKFINLEPLHWVETDLNVFLQTRGVVIRKNLPPDIHLELQLADEALCVRLDHEQMQTLIENLVSNAVNAMPDGGKITFATHVAPKLLPPHLAGEARDYAVLEVRDTGAGMSKEVRTHLFELNFSTSENGTGLGLTLVKKIADAHSGHIEVESETGAGTVFSVYLPIL